MLKFTLMPGVPASTARAIGILQGDGELNTDSGIDDLGKKDRRKLFSNFESWIAGNNEPQTRFHGFGGEYKRCFVFKVRRDTVRHRFYGFLCNPKPKSDPRFMLCVLAIYVTKQQTETDYSVLNRVNQWSAYMPAKIAIAEVYPEFLTEIKPWTQ